MSVAVLAARPSSTLAIVATLALVALLNFLLRLCGRGGSLLSRATEEWFLGVGAVCVVGDVVVTGLRVRKVHGGEEPAILLWVDMLVQIVGLGAVKVAVALAVLRCAVRSWHRHVVLVHLCLTTILTVFWFGSVLLFNGPITIEWSATTDATATVRLLDFLNSTLDVASGVLIAVLPVPLVWTTQSHLNLRTQVAIIAIYTCTAAALTFASLRTYLFYDTWQAPSTPSTSTPPTLQITLCTSISLALALLSASLFPTSALPNLLSSFTPRRLSKRTLTSPSPSTPRTYPSNTFASTDTVIRHPAPSPLTLRFHDAESNLDFDMASTTPSRAQTMRSSSQTYPQSHPQPPTLFDTQRTSHHPTLFNTQQSPHRHSRTATEKPEQDGDQDAASEVQATDRRVSDWSQFSGFTFYTSPAHSARQSARQSLLGHDVASVVAVTLPSLSKISGSAAASASGSASATAIPTTSTPHRPRHTSMGELQLRTQTLHSRREGMKNDTVGARDGVGLAVSTLGGTRVPSEAPAGKPEGSEGHGNSQGNSQGNGQGNGQEGEEMQELARLFADRTRVWGGGGAGCGSSRAEGKGERGGERETRRDDAKRRPRVDEVGGA